MKMKVTKKINTSGNVHLPVTVREEAGIPVNSAVDVEVDGQKIVISKHFPVCRFCGSPEHVFTVMNMEICRKCAGEISRKAGEIK